MPWVEVNQARVWYEVSGSGSNPAMVLVSGTGGTMYSNWDHLMPAFEKKHQVLRVDYSGAGKTTDTNQRLTVQMLADQVMGAVRAARIDRFDLVGYSLGTSICISIAATYPQRVRTMTLLAGFSDGTDTRNVLQTGLWLALIEYDPVLFAKMIVLNGMSPARVAAMSETELQAWIDAICHNNDWRGISRQIDLDRRLDVSDLLGLIRSPTMVIGCKHDQVVPISHAKSLARNIAGACYAELDAGHLAPFEQADAFSRLVLSFLQK